MQIDTPIAGLTGASLLTGQAESAPGRVALGLSKRQTQEAYLEVHDVLPTALLTDCLLNAAASHCLLVLHILLRQLTDCLVDIHCQGSLSLLVQYLILAQLVVICRPG